MRFFLVLAALLLLAGCVLNTQESSGNESVRIVGEKIYNESEEGEGKEENTSRSESITDTNLNETERNATDPNIANETYGNNKDYENEAKIDGTYFGNGAYVLVLRDISMHRNEQGYCALFEIVWAENGSNIQKLQICPGEDADWISPDGHLYRIKVFETAAGYTGRARWAKVAVYG